MSLNYTSPLSSLKSRTFSGTSVTACAFLAVPERIASSYTHHPEREGKRKIFPLSLPSFPQHGKNLTGMVKF